MAEFEIKQAGSEDRARVIALVSKMWGEDISARYDWLYESNPHGRALTWIAIETQTGETVGCTSIFPRNVIVGRTSRLGSIGGDCYIEPRVRRRGLATQLHRASLGGMREHGIDFMYGPPNPNNLIALQKAGSNVIATFKRWVRPLTGSSVYRAAFGSTPSKLEARLANLPIIVFDRLVRANVGGVTLEAVEQFGPEFDAMFEQASAEYPLACVRDSRYLQWRYFEAPARRQFPFAVRRDGELAGLVALERDSDHAAIVDLFTVPDPRLTDATLQLLIDQVTAANCAGIEISCTPDPTITPRLRRLGFMARSERSFQVAVADDDPQKDQLLQTNNWHFLAADQDMDTFFSSLPE